MDVTSTARGERSEGRSTRVFVRGVAPGVSERHAASCALSRGLRRGICDCRPAFLARVTDPAGRRRTATFASLVDAVSFVSAGGLEQVQRELPVDAGNGAVDPVVGSLTLEQAARWFLERAVAGKIVNRSGERYSQATLRSYETQLRRRVLPFVEARSGRPLAELPLETVTNRVAQSLANELAASASAATTRTAIAALQSVMREAYEAGVTEMERPTRLRLPSAPKPRQRVLRPAEVAALLEAARVDDVRFGRSFALPLIQLLARTGARVSEVLALEWGEHGLDMTAEPPVMRIAKSKTDAGVRNVWLDVETESILQSHRAASGKPRDGVLVFRRADGERSDRFGIARATIRRVAKAAGVPGVSPHVFRHSHVTQLVADGASIVDIAARVGHADPRHTLSLYAKPTDEGQARIVKLLERRCRGA